MSGLTFLYPLFLAGLAAAAIPIILHLFRRRSETVVDFPAVRLIDQAPVETRRRRRLRELVLLALRVTALALLALAFARPYFAAAPAVLSTPTTVIALDTSYSLSAPGQFAAAQQAARAAIDRVAVTDRTAVVTFADTAVVALEPTTDRSAAIQAIEEASVTAGATRFRSALARAAETVGPEGRIVVITDLQQTGWDASDEGAVPDGIELEVVGVPPPSGNLAVTAARRENDAVVAAVHNFGDRAERVAVRLRVGEREASAVTVSVAAQAAAEVRLPGTLPPRGAAVVTVDDPRGYQLDNARFLVLDPPQATAVVVVTAEPPGSSDAGLYVERALSVAEDGRAFAVSLVDGPTFSAASDTSADPGALILLGTTTLDRRGRERVATFLREGGRVLATLGPDIDMATLADTLGVTVEASAAPVPAGRSTLVPVDGRHPVFRPFMNPTGALGDVPFAQVRRLGESPSVQVLARFSGGGNALTEQTVGTGRLLLFASDLDNRWNRFPLNPAFVPWLLETVRYLTQGRGALQLFTLPTVPAGVPLTPGVHALTSTASPGGSRPVAVNVDIREANPARTSVEEFEAAVTRLNQVAPVRAQTAAKAQEEEQRLWQWGLLAMFIGLACEGLIGRRAS